MNSHNLALVEARLHRQTIPNKISHEEIDWSPVMVPALTEERKRHSPEACTDGPDRSPAAQRWRSRSFWCGRGDYDLQKRDRQICDWYKLGWTQKDIAIEVGRHRSTVSKILKANGIASRAGDNRARDREIRLQYGNGATQEEIRREHGISQGRVSQILRKNHPKEPNTRGVLSKDLPSRGNSFSLIQTDMVCLWASSICSRHRPHRGPGRTPKSHFLHSPGSGCERCLHLDERLRRRRRRPRRWEIDPERLSTITHLARKSLEETHDYLDLPRTETRGESHLRSRTRRSESWSNFRLRLRYGRENSRRRYSVFD